MKPIAIVLLAISLSAGAQTINPTQVRGNAVVQNPVSSSQAISSDLALGFHKITNSLNYFNYVYSSNDFQAPAAVTNRTWANPEHYIAVTDNSPYSTNPNPQADLTATPILHIESFNNSPNDAAPIYVHQRCTATVAGNPPNNNGCVGIISAVDNTAGSKSFLEAGNFIMQIFSTDPLIQAQGFEMNSFNNSGSDSRLQDNNAYTRGPYYGISSTVGGSNEMVAAFHSTQLQSGSWQYGVFVEQAVEANYMAGSPGGGNGGQDGLRLSPLQPATSTTNSPSMPIGFRTMQWNGSTTTPFATTIKAIPLTSGVNPVTCLDVSFTGKPNIADICSDGSVQVRGTSWRTFNGSPSGVCKPGDFGTNASPVDKNSALYVCFPANTWNALQAVP